MRYYSSQKLILRQIFTSKCFLVSFRDSLEFLLFCVTWHLHGGLYQLSCWLKKCSIWKVFFRYVFPASATAIRQSINIASFVFLHLACVAAGPRTLLNHLKIYVWGRFTRKVNTYLRLFNERVSWVMHVFLFCFVLKKQRFQNATVRCGVLFVSRSL